MPLIGHKAMLIKNITAGVKHGNRRKKQGEKKLDDYWINLVAEILL
jgi:hypothetical protein